MEKVSRRLFYIYRNFTMHESWAEWMNGICLIWSRGRLISPSLLVGDDRYLNLSSQKRPTGRNLGGNRLVRRSGTASRGTVVLVFSLRMRRFPLTLVLTIFVRMKCKMSINGNTSPIFKILFFKNIWIYLRLIFFCSVQIKDSCIVDRENRKFYLLFLRLICDWLQQMLYLVLINRAGGLYGRILTEVASTDRTQWGLYQRPRSRLSHTKIVPYRPT